MHTNQHLWNKIVEIEDKLQRLIDLISDANDVQQWIGPDFEGQAVNYFGTAEEIEEARDEFEM